MSNPMFRRILPAAALLPFLALSCQQFAQGGPRPGTRAGSDQGTATRPDVPYVEGETCMRSDDCPAETRCFDGRCLPQTRTLQGEVHTERGARALAVGGFDEAAEAFRAAERAYADRRIPVPAVVSCGLSRALTAMTDRGAGGDVREAAARALAQCLATAPRGSSMADQATAALASLSERGLEIAALDRNGATLMTGRDPRPTPENTRAQIVFAGTAEGARGALRTLVTSDAVKREVVRCFLQWWERSHQNSDQGALRVTYTRGVDEYDELLAPRLTVVAADLAPESADAGANTHWLQCSANAIQSAATSLRWPGRQERWSEPVMISVGSQ